MFGKQSNKHENILILGLGGVGLYLAKRLIDDEQAVTIIESNPQLIAFAEGQIDARLIQGDAMSIRCWKNAGVNQIDYMIAVTDNDAVNMMAARIAHRLGIPRNIARVRSLEFGQPDSLLTAEDLNLDLIIHPEELVSQEIVRTIQTSDSNEIIELAESKILILATGIAPRSPIAGLTLQELAARYHDIPFRVAAIARGIRTIIPYGQQKLHPGDHIAIMFPAAFRDQVLEFTSTAQKRQQRVLILGGGLVGARVAELLNKQVAVTLLEKDADRAKLLSEQLKGVELLHGDGSRLDVLAEAGIQAADTLVTCTGDNETNIMTSLLGKHLYSIEDDEETDEKRKKLHTISLVGKEDYLILAASTGTDIALNKKVLAANEIVKFIRSSEFHSVAHLHGFDVEVVELTPMPKAPVTRKPLSKLDPIFRDKMIIGAIHRRGEWEIAMGDTQIEANEPVVVICPSMLLKDVRKLFLG
ncbi:MAG: Trk system potassium transporter TrkA [Desulforhopalus sp.]|nr:Trk system potassium transporter TrkA [Desulforhopalus sp.]